MLRQRACSALRFRDLELAPHAALGMFVLCCVVGVFRMLEERETKGADSWPQELEGGSEGATVALSSIRCAKRAGSDFSGHGGSPSRLDLLQMRHFARFLALFAALLIALPVGALPAMYYCRWMGQTMSSCCCRGHEAKAKPKKQAGDELRRAPCCEIIQPSDAASPGTREPPVRVDAAAVVARVPIEVEPAVESRALAPTPAQARAPPGVGPPLFLSHCSLLI